jgi:hypothetical protein
LKPSLDGGTDFAVGGATTAALGVEVGDFETYASLKNLSPTRLDDALCTLDIGANDIINALSDPATDAGVVTAAAHSAASEVKELHADGARSSITRFRTSALRPISLRGRAINQFAAQLFNTTLLDDLTSIEPAPRRSKRPSSTASCSPMSSPTRSATASPTSRRRVSR